MIPLEYIITILTSTAAGIGFVTIASALRMLLGRVYLKTKLSIDGKTINVDARQMDELKHFILRLMDKPQVFIAHSFKDNAQAKKLAQELKKREIRVWLAEEQIKPGDIIKKKIEDGLVTSGYLLALLSDASLTSKWVQNEFKMALFRESHGKWPRVIPVLIEPVDIPIHIQGKLYIDLTHDYESGVERIVSAIKDEYVKVSSRDGPNKGHSLANA